MENDVNKVGVFLIAFVTIIVAIVLLSTTSDSAYLGTDAVYTATNESITLTNYTAIDLANNWVTSITSVALPNGTAIATTGATNYSVARLNVENVAQITYYSNTSIADYTGNTTYVTYEYQDDNYIRSGSARVLIRLIPLFFALAVLAVALWAMYKMGLLDMIK